MLESTHMKFVFLFAKKNGGFVLANWAIGQKSFDSLPPVVGLTNIPLRMFKGESLEY